MDTESLYLFRDLCRTRNMTQTAKNFFLTQSTLSKRLARLEEELGYPLLLRSKGRQEAELTGKGERFLGVVVHMLELYEEGLSFREEQERYLLRLGCMRSAQEYFLAGFLQDYLLGHPRCSLTLEDHHSVEIRDLLQEGLLDVGIVQIPLASRGLVSELLYEEPFLVVMKEPGHFQGKKIISMEDLDGKQEIFQIFTEEFRSWHDQYWRALDSKIRVNSTPTAEKYFQGPEDWMLVPRSVAAAMKKQGFSIFPLAERTPFHRLYLASRQGEDRLWVKEMTAALQQHFQDLKKGQMDRRSF
ncbi:LysR family transcriptional regulator [Acidaminococcus fermentans]|uniref:LysR family transcriptional regulator n=1 Tax=Acidaminococcus fermentans TaxID=905 RepID=UPI00249184EE|nr:LysR family transcriptional regulator [Acidaminococcus fermentans]